VALSSSVAWALATDGDGTTSLDEVGYRSHRHRWGYRYFFGTLEAVDRTSRDYSRLDTHWDRLRSAE